MVGSRFDAGIGADIDLVDCDVHVRPPEASDLGPYMPKHWAEYVELTGFTTLQPLEISYPSGAPTTVHPDLAVEFADSARDDFALVSKHAFCQWDARNVILNCLYPLSTVVHPDLCAALTRALNDWLRAEWLERDSRLRASLVVPPHDPLLAAEEIARVGCDPRFVQVLLPVRSNALYGNRLFHRMFDAAAQRDLVVGLHFGGYAHGVSPTGSGWPTYFLEEYAGMAQVFQSQLRSLVFQGVFDKFPSTRVALIESGFAWLPAHMWRMDSDWKNLRRETPWLRRPPSDYLREHVRVALQPVDLPVDDRARALLFDQLDPSDWLMFSTDYPHWQFDSGHDCLPADLPPKALSAIMAGNAREFYRLEA
jgi:predicted TIM-barrel fold metal-dependent hydrolase